MRIVLGILILLCFCWNVQAASLPQSIVGFVVAKDAVTDEQLIASGFTVTLEYNAIQLNTVTEATGVYIFDAVLLEGPTLLRFTISGTIPGYQPINASTSIVVNLGSGDVLILNIVFDGAIPIDQGSALLAYKDGLILTGLIIEIVDANSPDILLEGAELTVVDSGQKFTSDSIGMVSFSTNLSFATFRVARRGYISDEFFFNFSEGLRTITLPLTPDPQYRPVADVNEDGSTNALDIQFLINALLIQTTAFILDINLDGSVNSSDVQLTINRVLGTN